MFKIEIYRSGPNEIETAEFTTKAKLTTAFNAASPALPGNERVANVFGIDLSLDAPFNRIMAASRDDR